MLLIRHCVEESNTEGNIVIDPSKIRHVVISGGKIKSMSGLIDPLSHLNLDYPDHKVTKCIVSTKLEIGSQVLFDDRGFIFANVLPTSFRHYGYVDYTQRLFDIIEAVKQYRERRIVVGNK